MTEKQQFESREELAQRRLLETATVKYEPPPALDFSENGPEPKTPTEPTAFEDVIAVFERWLELPDTTPVYATLGAVAANQLPGDPVWFGLVAPPSSTKTEILNSTSHVPDVYPAATLTLASLLSGTPRKERAQGAKGGLLREVGEFGIVVFKGFGSVLSMRPEPKGEVLGALREIYDGSWTRYLGNEGGKTLSWTGKLGLIFGVTPVLDSHHAVMGAMGERFVLCRLEESGEEQALRAFEHSGEETAAMRQELASAVAALFAGPRRQPCKTTLEEQREIAKLAALAVRVRSTVERDRNTKDIELVHGAEGPARLALALERLVSGLDALGADREHALAIVRRVALDSVPVLRIRLLRWLAEATEPVKTSTIAAALDLPTNTVRYRLQELAAYKLVSREAAAQHGEADLWEITRWARERLP
jgi:FaeA-like protein